ncbi:MAG: hypothetical protein JW969_15255 [Spirochaetales bacterium]|nr:hypothetical protein [Spirochaetales bacterium]
MKALSHILLLAGLFIILSCVNSKEQTTENGIWEEIDPVTGMVKTMKKISGYGYARNVNKSMAESMAKKMVYASVAEQVAGAAFEYETSSKYIQFSTNTGQVNLQGVRVISLKSYKAGKTWTCIAFAGGELELKLPKKHQKEVVNVTVTGTNIGDLEGNLKREALSAAVTRRFPDKKDIKAKGRLYITEITMDLPVDNGEFKASARFDVYFY